MSFFFFRGTFFQCDMNLLINYKKETLFLRHLLGQPARADGRDPAKITGRFRANFRLAMCTMLLALVINIQFTGKNRPCGAWTMSQLNCTSCPLVYFYSHSLS